MRLVGTQRNVHLLSTKDQPLLNGRDAFLFFDALLYPVNLWY